MLRFQNGLGVTKTPQEIKSLELRSNDLVFEINQFYVEVTGDGLTYKELARLKAMDLDVLMAKLESLKMGNIYEQEF